MTEPTESDTRAHANIIALAERVESATGPIDDSAIALAVGWTHHIEQHDDGMADDVWTDPQGKQHAWYPFYTASLDAAMTLVPDGLEWRLGNTVAGKGACAIWLDALAIRVCSSEAATPALALTASCLRAIAGGHNDHN